MLRLIIKFSLFLYVTAIPSPITGGENAVEAQFPYQLNLQKNRATTCGAVLIGRKIALTAGHCTYNVPTFSLSVIAGTLQQYDEGVRISVDRAEEHHKYNPKKDEFDISILFLKKPFNLSPKIKPIALTDENDVVPAGAFATVSGWGMDKENGEYTVDLKFANVLIWKQSECDKALVSFNSPVYCGGHKTGEENACAGDSGGPLVYQGKLVGLVSFGFGCGKPNKPAVYTNVAAYRGWIRTMTEI